MIMSKIELFENTMKLRDALRMPGVIKIQKTIKDVLREEELTKSERINNAKSQ